MATVTPGKVFSSNEIVTPTNLNALGVPTVSNIVNADISASAAIADTKLATISTTGKVANTATTASSLNTANSIVARDASGNFSAGTITATTFTGKLAPAVITEETAITSAASDDVVLLYNTSANGVRKITIDNLMRKINNVPYLEYAWSVNPSATGLTLAHNVFTTLTLNTEVSDTESLGSLSGNVVTLPAGTYQFEASCCISNDNVSGAEGLQYFRLTSGASILAIALLAPEYGSQSKILKLSGQFNLTASSGISLSVRPYNFDSGTLTVKERFYRSYVGIVSDPSTTEISHRVNLKLWKVG